jgi:cardiolipin synthase
MADQAFSRAASAQFVEGNTITLLKDAAQNYTAWLKAMERSTSWIHFQNYFITNDRTGRTFADVLAEKARQGIRVRLIYDWLGSLGRASGRFWDRLRDSGVEIRCFNPPRIDEPFGWIVRNHRKSITVDGRTGFVSGLCVGEAWEGDPARGIEPWRDTGVAITGPAVSDIEHAFAEVWDIMGPPLPEDETPLASALHPTGRVTLQVIASAPYTAGLYRLDQLVATLARSTLWLTDAYFVGIPTYVQALRAAAQDGVDVRLLVPGTTDIPIIRTMSRAGYQTLLEAGVRVFEWNGPMLHAKTAVADGRWARIGSSNLNLSSWIGNYELDVAVEDEDFAQAMERMYLEDLSRSTEVVFGSRRKVRLARGQPGMRPARGSGLGARRSGSIHRAGVGVIRLEKVVEAAISSRRILGSSEARITLLSGAALIVLAVVAVLWPKIFTVPLALFFTWLAVALFMRSFRLKHPRSQKRSPRRGRRGRKGS